MLEKSDSNSGFKGQLTIFRNNMDMDGMLLDIQVDISLLKLVD